MENKPTDYFKIYYIQQNKDLPFNRGAMKNIGFLWVKEKYPNNYKDITIVFNDVDTTPLNKCTIPDYSTKPGIVKHFYGYNFALGGIVSILAGDFEKINGFPNYYSWGYEDNELNNRVLDNKMTIDRSIFYPIYDTVNILQIQNSIKRVVNRCEFDRFVRKVKEGINTIYDVYCTVNDDSGFVDVLNFKTKYTVKQELNNEYDITKGNPPFIIGYSGRRRSSMNMII